MNFDHEVEKLQDQIISSTQELIKIKSVKSGPLDGKPFGEGINQALDYMLNLSNQLGFSTKNLDGRAGYAESGQGEKLVGVLTHLDVVPEGDGWSHPPYSAEIAGQKIYGRGAIDDKGPAVAALYALKAIEESGVNLNSRVRIIFGLDEESGSACMKHYTESEEIPACSFVPDANFPVIHGEKGILTFKLEKKFKKQPDSINIISILGGSRHNIVPNFCEAVIKVAGNTEQIRENFLDFFDRTQFDMEIDHSSDEIIVKSFGVAAHASLPGKGVNAVSQLMLFLNELEIPGELGQFIRFYAEKIGMDFTGSSLGCALSDDVSGNLTLNVGVINFENQKIELTFDIRYPVKHKGEDVLTQIRKSFAPLEVVLTEINDTKPLFIPPESPLVKSLVEVYSDYTGNSASPITIGGGTYARSMPNAVAFGPLFPGEPELAHQTDENIPIENLMRNVKIFARAIYKLSE